MTNILINFFELGLMRNQNIENSELEVGTFICDLEHVDRNEAVFILNIGFQFERCLHKQEITKQNS